MFAVTSVLTNEMASFCFRIKRNRILARKGEKILSPVQVSNFEGLHTYGLKEKPAQIKLYVEMVAVLFLSNLTCSEILSTIQRGLSSLVSVDLKIN